jgi:hypothetical protein
MTFKCTNIPQVFEEFAFLLVFPLYLGQLLRMQISQYLCIIALRIKGEISQKGRRTGREEFLHHNSRGEREKID